MLLSFSPLKRNQKQSTQQKKIHPLRAEARQFLLNVTSNFNATLFAWIIAVDHLWKIYCSEHLTVQDLQFAPSYVSGL